MSSARKFISCRGFELSHRLGTINPVPPRARRSVLSYRHTPACRPFPPRRARGENRRRSNRIDEAVIHRHQAGIGDKGEQFPAARLEADPSDATTKISCGIEAGLDDDFTFPVDVAPGAPQLAIRFSKRRQPFREECRLGELRLDEHVAFRIDEAPQIAHLHGGQPFLEWIGRLKDRRNDELPLFIHETRFAVHPNHEQRRFLPLLLHRLFGSLASFP